jgi:hypothetical protein
MFSFAWRCSSLTHALALSSDAWIMRSVYEAPKAGRGGGGDYSLCDVVDYDRAVRVAVVHGCQRLIALLAGSIPGMQHQHCESGTSWRG